MTNPEDPTRFYLIRIAGSYEIWELRRSELEQELKRHQAESIVSFRLRSEAEHALQSLFLTRQSKQN